MSRPRPGAWAGGSDIIRERLEQLVWLDVQGPCQIEEHLQGAGLRMVGGLQCAQVGSADVGLLCEHCLSVAGKPSVIGEIEGDGQVVIYIFKFGLFAVRHKIPLFLNNV